MPSRRLLLLAVGSAGAAMFLRPAQARSPRGMWFDPTQLPSFSGRLERWLMNPAGDVDRALLREGVQILFPPSEAEALMGAIAVDSNFTAYGIRARNAPVVTMLAWARNDTEPAAFVASPSWFASESRGREELTVQGRIRAPLLTPQGEGMGVITDEGNTIRLPVEVHEAMADRLKPGEVVAAAGLGTKREEQHSIDAARIGRSVDRLEPLPSPTAGRRP
jgi:hypothetical protein